MSEDRGARRRQTTWCPRAAAAAGLSVETNRARTNVACLVRRVDLLQPRDLAGRDGQLRHRAAFARSVPVFFARWGNRGVANRQGNSILAPRLNAGQAFDDVEHLSARVLVPVSVGAGLEADEAC